MGRKSNPQIASKTASYSADLLDDVIEMDATGGARTVTLPGANFQYGNEFTVVKKDSSVNAVSITAAASSTINGSASAYVLTRQNQAAVLQSDGASNYRVTHQTGSGKSGAGTALTPSATISLDPTLDENFSLVPGQACTINAASIGAAGQDLFLFITTSGASSFVITLGTNFLSSGTLATGTVSAKKFLVKFKSDGAAWLEQSRTAAL